ncbi:MAG: hypothetical protein ACLPUO_00855 [Streptosporangiaceae bacterium]|jgi:hypothetical protein
MHQLRTEGVLNDLTKIEALPSVARGYVITDAGWNLLDFAAPLHALTSGSLLFRTLPIQGYATIDGQSANVVNSATIQPIVQAACYLKPGGPGAQPSAQGAQPGGHPAHGGHHQGAAARRKITADVLNGGYTAGLAGRVSAVLKKAG